MDSQEALTEQEQALLAWLDRNGGVSARQILAQTEFEPRQVWAARQHQAQLGQVLAAPGRAGLLVMRDDPDRLDGTLQAGGGGEAAPVTVVKGLAEPVPGLTERTQRASIARFLVDRLGAEAAARLAGH